MRIFAVAVLSFFVNSLAFTYPDFESNFAPTPVFPNGRIDYSFTNSTTYIPFSKFEAYYRNDFLNPDFLDYGKFTARIYPQTGSATLARMYIPSEVRGSGIGSQLMNTFMNTPEMQGINKLTLTPLAETNLQSFKSAMQFVPDSVAPELRSSVAFSQGTATGRSLADHGFFPSNMYVEGDIVIANLQRSATNPLPFSPELEMAAARRYDTSMPPEVLDYARGSVTAQNNLAMAQAGVRSLSVAGVGLGFAAMLTQLPRGLEQAFWMGYKRNYDIVEGINNGNKGLPKKGPGFEEGLGQYDSTVTSYGPHRFGMFLVPVRRETMDGEPVSPWRVHRPNYPIDGLVFTGNPRFPGGKIIIDRDGLKKGESWHGRGDPLAPLNRKSDCPPK